VKEPILRSILKAEMANIKVEDFGINFSKVHCPKCGEKQPMVRRPKGWREILFGGWTCNKCGCKMDKYGVELKKNSKE